MIFEWRVENRYEPGVNLSAENLYRATEQKQLARSYSRGGSKTDRRSFPDGITTANLNQLRD